MKSSTTEMLHFLSIANCKNVRIFSKRQRTCDFLLGQSEEADKLHCL